MGKLLKPNKIYKCAFCDAEEGKLRPVGRYTVVLKELEFQGGMKKACQGCYQSVKNELYKQTVKQQKMNANWILKWKNKGFLFFVLCAVIIITSSVIFAQPPGLPSTPDQAPIDGGLGLLAAAGGTYAWRKLKAKNIKG